MIRVSADPRQGEWLISIRDNGIGIDPQYHELVFELFKRLHGHGVSGLGSGSTFRFTRGRRRLAWIDYSARPKYNHGHGGVDPCPS